MKEKIVIEEKTFKDFLLKHKDNHEICSFSPLVIMSRCRVEQLPETWEELKELCKDIKGISFGKDGLTEETEYICINDSVYFSITGEICFGIEPFAENRTPQQMWNIIKSLIGEE